MLSDRDIVKLVNDFRAELDILGKREFTILNYCSTIKNFLKFVQENNWELDELSVEHVKEWFKSLREKNISHRALARHLFALKSFFKLVLKKDIDMPVPRFEERLPNFLTVDEIRKLINAAGEMEKDDFLNLRNKTMLMLAFDCALRKRELVNLDVDDVDLERGMVRIRGKGGREEYVHIIEDATISYLQKYLETRSGRVVPGEKALFISILGKRIHPNTIEHIFKKAKQLAGIEKKGSVHLLRHSRATFLLQSGWDIREVQEHLRHRRLSTTAIYTHVTHEWLGRKKKETRKIFSS